MIHHLKKPVIGRSRIIELYSVYTGENKATWIKQGFSTKFTQSMYHSILCFSDVQFDLLETLKSSYHKNIQGHKNTTYGINFSHKRFSLLNITRSL